MHILLIGCGRSGRHLVKLFTEQGLDVIVVDRDRERLDRIADLNVEMVAGYPIDIEILETAGIRQAAAVIAMDENENTNIMVCEIAQKIYDIKYCLARVYSPENEEFVRSLGISPICATSLTVDKTIEILGLQDNNIDLGV